MAKPDVEKIQSSFNAIQHLLRRIQRDPRLAYYFGGTQSLELLLQAHADLTEQDVAVVRLAYIPTLKYEAPPAPVGA